MRIDFNEVELMDLEEAVRARVRDLYTELAHTDQRGYQEMLRERCERFERLGARLEMMSGQAQQEITP